jgi:hypothetical protein
VGAGPAAGEGGRKTWNQQLERYARAVGCNSTLAADMVTENGDGEVGSGTASAVVAGSHQVGKITLTVSVCRGGVLDL